MLKKLKKLKRLKKLTCLILGLLLLCTLFACCQVNKIDNVLDYPFDSNKLPKRVEAAGKSYPVRHYSISAISLPIVYNEFGDHDPNGMMYVLNENKDKVLDYVKKNPTKPCDSVEPLVIRANAGDVVVVDFYNELPTSASIHIAGVKTNVQKSDGGIVGYNKDTTTEDHIRYVWYAQKEGTYLFHDMSDTRSLEDSKNIHGLFGVLAVEAKGSSWTDPTTGKPLLSGCHADIRNPFKPDFREFVTVFHDEPEIKDINGNNPTNHEIGIEESGLHSCQ